MRSLLIAALLFACGSDKTSTPSTPTTAPAPVTAAPALPPPPAAKQPMAGAPTTAGHDFTAEGTALFIVGACGEGSSPEAEVVPAARRKRHCDVVGAAQTQYGDRWVKKAREFFADAVPKDAPKRVVYPFAGGDLSTALTVYPDADEITTLSLEPAGDPRTIFTLRGGELDSALAKVEYELKFLYKVNFSNTMNMIDAMRGGALPTQLIFGLSALKLHGYEVVALRYFKLDDQGAIKYLTDDDVKQAPAM